MVLRPWDLDEKVYQRVAKLAPNLRQDALKSYQSHYHNSYFVPCVAVFVIYGLVLLCLLAATVNAFLKSFYPRCHHSISRRLGWWRAHVWEHPLVTLQHAQVVKMTNHPSLNWLTFQLPLRGESLIVVGMLLANFLPLILGYDLFLDHNTLYAGPRSKLDQITRHLSDRTAILGTAQLPLLIMFASKRTPLALVSQLSMNTLMLLHRWIARAFWVHILIHTAGFSALYVSRNIYHQEWHEAYFKWGVVAFFMMSGLVFLSLRTLRQKHYEVFIFLHILMALFAVIGTYFHIHLLHSSRFEMFVVLTELAAAIWAFDRFVRLGGRLLISIYRLDFSSASDGKEGKKIKCATAHVSTCGPNHLRMRIELPCSRLKLNNTLSRSPSPSHNSQRLSLGSLAKIGAGDDIRITVPRLQWVGDHPFTVFNVGQVNEHMGYLDLLIKKEAGLTKKLGVRAAATLDVDAGVGMDVEIAGACLPWEGRKPLTVLLDGPFGTMPSLEPSQDAVLVAGGIAITFCYPLFTAAARGAFMGLETCKLVWILRDSANLCLIQEAFSQLVAEIKEQPIPPKCKLMLDIYITGRQTGGGPDTQIQTQWLEKTVGGIERRPELEKNHSSLTSSSSSSGSSIKSGPVHLQPEASDTLVGHSNIVSITKHLGRPNSIAELHSHLDGSPSSKTRRLTIASCGPASLCDAVRKEAVQLIKTGADVRLVEDCFTW